VEGELIKPREVFTLSRKTERDKEMRNVIKNV
jgi:hypothetical protein